MTTDQEQAAEQQEVEHRGAPTGRVIYKTILQEGKDELSRPSSALFWSGLAAGLSMGFSMIAEGLLSTYLPDASWQPLVAKFGYSAGFLIVILGRQQLFTENTLTPVLPLLQRKTAAALRNVLRLWGVVLVANLIGALAVALVAAHTNAFDPPVREAFAEIGRKAMSHGFGTVLLRGIFAGWLIALMVWLLPFAETARVWVIIITYLVGLGGFSHSRVGRDVYAGGDGGNVLAGGAGRLRRADLDRQRDRRRHARGRAQPRPGGLRRRGRRSLGGAAREAGRKVSAAAHNAPLLAADWR